MKGTKYIPLKIWEFSTYMLQRRQETCDIDIVLVLLNITHVH